MPIASFPCCCADRPAAKLFLAISFTFTRGCWNAPRILRDDFLGGSLTALPIIETEAQDISAYIPTNLISITDGQIYLSPTLFDLGILPAVDVGKSVSRVGGEAQRAAYRAVAGDLKLAYAQFTELESFAKFGTRLDEHTRKIIDHGQRIRAVLKQPELEPASVPEQIIILMALTGGLLDGVPIDKVRDAEQALRKAAADIPAAICQRFSSNDKLSDEDRQAILKVISNALSARFRKEESMSDTLASLRRKISGAGDLESVVRTMKALAAASIGQYEKSVLALADYYRTVELGLVVCLRKRRGAVVGQAGRMDKSPKRVSAIVFGSDQGLVGQFNDVLADFVVETLNALPGEKKLWAVGERIHARLTDAGLPPVGLFAVPNSVNAITPLVGQILIETEAHHEKGEIETFNFTSSTTSPGPGRLMSQLVNICCPWMHNGVSGWPISPGRQKTCPRSSAAGSRRCGPSSGNISLFHSSRLAPNRWPAKTRADWPPCNERKKHRRTGRYPESNLPPHAPDLH